MASSLSALFKAKSRISCMLGQEIFLLEGNLHCVPAHGSGRTQEALNGVVLDSPVFAICNAQEWSVGVSNFL